MSLPAIMATPDKRELRLESKKRKIEALLELTRDDIVNGNMSEKHKNAELEDPTKPSPSDASDEASSDAANISKTKEDLGKFRAQLRERQKAAMASPKVYLSVQPIEGFPDRFVECQDGLFMFDIQHLLLYALQGGISSYRPRWCKLLRPGRISKIGIAIIEGVGATDFTTFTQSFPHLSSSFPLSVQLVSPGEYGQQTATELFMVPVSARRLKRRLPCITDDDGKFQGSVGNSEPALKRKRDELPAVSRVGLLLNQEQMVRDGFPLPHLRSEKTHHYLLTKKVYKPVTESSPMFALDCEMCETSAGHSELTRIAIVNEKRECIYDTLVKPREPITNYLTRFSGITRKMLKHVHTRIEEVQRHLQEMLPRDAILVGHSLNFDLDALKMMHPYVIDTSVLYNESDGQGWKPGLKRLAAQVLGKQIQTGKDGHDPHEDALTALELVQHWLELKDNFNTPPSLPSLPKTNGVETNSAETNSVETTSAETSSAETSSVETTGESSSPSTEPTAAVEPAVNHASDENGNANSKEEIPKESDVLPLEITKDNTMNVDSAVPPLVQSVVDEDNDLETASVAGSCISSNAGVVPGDGIRFNDAFNRRARTGFHESYFDLVKVAGKKAFLSGFEKDSVSANDSVEIVEADSDKQVVRGCRDAAVQHFVVCARFTDTSRELSRHTCVGGGQSPSCSACLENVLQRVDKNVKKFCRLFGEHSLIVVVCAGGPRKPDEPSQNALCFVKIV